MRIHLSWLEEFVALPPLATLTQQLTQAGLEVEGVFDLDAGGTAIELSVSPNRGDLLSHLGVARELAAQSGQRLGGPKWRLGELGPDVALGARLACDEPQHCRRIMGRVVRKVRVGPSPAWLVERLGAIGQRSINNVVDVTNYVMHELGQPLHAYDLDKLAPDNRLPSLRVRMAHDNEQLVTLDNKVRKLSREDLVIADGEGPVALAGVMGGKASEVTEATEAVLLEAGVFSPTLVRRTSRRHALRSEASQHFERGVDMTQLARALDRCAQLLTLVAAGEVDKGTLEVAAHKEHPREVRLRLARLERLLGMALPAENVVQLLDPLELRCRSRRDDTLVFEVPSFRSDLEEEIDLIEEVARRYGYDRLPEHIPDTHGDTALRPLVRDARAIVRQAWLHQHVSETVSFALTHPDRAAPTLAAGQAAVTLLNPLGHATSCLRTSLLPHLFDTVAYNLRRGQSHVRIFEIGEVFVQLPASTKPKDPAASAQKDLTKQPRSNREGALGASLPHEEERVAAVLEGERHAGAWYGQGAALDLSDVLGLIDAAVLPFDVATPLTWQSAQHPYLADGHTAELVTTWEGHVISLAFAGKLAPSVARARDLPPQLFACELRLGALRALPQRKQRAVVPPKVMGTRRDLALIAAEGVEVEALRTYIAEHAGGELGREVVARVWVFDRYVGKPIAKGHVSYGIAVLYQHPERTLTDVEVNAAYIALLPKLSAHFGVTQRGVA